jgi:transcriptional regulator with XRE-family HTH domain
LRLELLPVSSIAERLLQLRGKTRQGDFAATLGINPNTLRGYESGRALPNQEVMEKICRVFSVNPAWLLLGQGEIEQNDREKQQPPAATALKRDDHAVPAACGNCLELYEKLVQSQEREIALVRENSDLKVENSALKARILA